MKHRRNGVCVGGGPVQKVMWALFSFDGRVNRGVWWACNAAFLAVLIAAFIVPTAVWRAPAAAEYQQTWSRYCSGTPWEAGPTCRLDTSEWLTMRAAERKYLAAIEDFYAIVGSFMILSVLLILWPSWAVGAKRLHDTGHSGWWLLLTFVPYVGALALFVWLGFWPGKKQAAESDAPNGNPEEETTQAEA